MNNKILKIATRGSRLALIQANLVKNKIESFFKDIKIEIIIVKTKGDNINNIPLHKTELTGLFIKELEDSLINNTADIAVHSLKDLPFKLPENLELSGTLERSDYRDVLIHINKKKLVSLTKDDIIATSSLRRKAELLNINKNFKIIDIRGNVDTRIEKLKNGYCSALILAAAGVIRLNLEEYITEYIDAEIMMPAPCQGIIGIETRKNDEYIKNIIKKINDKNTFISAECERAFLKKLQAGCEVPAGCISKIENDMIKIKGLISDLNGDKIIKDSAAGKINDYVKTGELLAEKLLNNGGEDILNIIKKENNKNYE